MPWDFIAKNEPIQKTFQQARCVITVILYYYFYKTLLNKIKNTNICSIRLKFFLCKLGSIHNKNM